MNIILISPISISVGVGSNFGMNNGGSALPIVSLNFPTPLAQELTANLFQPHAQPEHFLFGVNDQGRETIEVSLFFLAELTKPISLPVVTAISGDLSPGPAPCLILIGTEADIRRGGVENFLSHQARLGKYYVVCGNAALADSVLTPIVDDWRVELKKMYPLDEIRRIIWEKVQSK